MMPSISPRNEGTAAPSTGPPQGSRAALADIEGVLRLEPCPDGIDILHVIGEVDASLAPTFRAVLLAEAIGRPGIAIDASCAGEFSAEAVGALQDAVAQAQTCGGDVVFVTGSALREAFRRIGIRRLAATTLTVAEATALLRD